MKTFTGFCALAGADAPLAACGEKQQVGRRRTAPATPSCAPMVRRRLGRSDDEYVDRVNKSHGASSAADNAMATTYKQQMEAAKALVGQHPGQDRIGERLQAGERCVAISLRRW